MDYKALLKKYAGHVAACEGVDFIDYGRFQDASEGKFTDEDIAELYVLSGMTLEEFEKDRAEYRALFD
ncbi:hypothetical protein [Xenophilus sp. Marseille-Q4582]|uniref:hypothetical protein n=1 Tax=Xenophilus sp. Marseille-Q4582 TaxID=2866600 RepID=UPI001CE42AA3|nr:hypothetical protein [Xenophilus sp. Marseille-Q4582]